MFGIVKRAGAALAVGLLAVAAMQSPARAASITDGNSTLTINPNSPAPFVSQWSIDGVNQFGGTPAGGDNLEFFNGTQYVPINTLTVQSSFFSDPIASVTYAGTYEGDNFTITVKDILSGGNPGSGASAINETITVNNLGPTQVPGVNPAGLVASPVQFQIKDLVDFNVNGTANNDTLRLTPSGSPNTATQTDPTGAKITWAATPTPNSFELGTNGIFSSTLGPRTGNEAFESVWDLSLAPLGTGIISITESASGIHSTAESIPMPSSVWNSLATLAGLGFWAAIRRGRRMMA
jgi:hypothetical protein